MARWVGGPLRILVVDDDRLHRHLVRVLLQAAGHHVEEAADRAEACTAVASGVHDAVVMDVVMPGLGGLEATRRIRGLHGRVSGVRVVGMSRAENRPACLAAGMDAFLPKPTGTSRLVPELERLLAA